MREWKRTILGAMMLGASSGALAQGSAGFCRKAPLLAALPPEQQAMAPAPSRLRRASFTGQPEPDTQICPDGSIIPVTEPCPVPPPPPPPAPEAEGSEADAITVTGSAITGDSSGRRSLESTSPIPNSRLRGQGGRPPAGLLTAGDHDDLLNPEHYAYYVHASRDLGQRMAVLPMLDPRRSLTIELRDEQGRPRGQELVSVECSDGNRLALRTTADGRAVFFPTLDRLSEWVTVRVRGETRTVAVPGGQGNQEYRLRMAGNAAPVRAMDLMVVLDCTGSMGDEIAFLKSELRAILTDLKRRHPQLDLRVGLVAYRDIGDEFVTRTYRLSADLDSLDAVIAQQRGVGGGDMPEAVDQALARAIDQDWREEAVKSLLLVADAPPHDAKMGLAWAAAEAARAKRIQIVPVASSGVDKSAEYFFRASAALTQSRYVFLTDDSGIGNRHKEPEVACYLVTSLASTIRRVLDSQLSGRRIEPGEAEVIRVNGDYDAGRCGLPPKITRAPPLAWPQAD